MAKGVYTISSKQNKLENNAPLLIQKGQQNCLQKGPCIAFIQQGSCLTSITRIFPEFVLSGGLGAIFNLVSSARPNCFVYLLKIVL